MDNNPKPIITQLPDGRIIKESVEHGFQERKNGQWVKADPFDMDDLWQNGKVLSI